MAYNGHNIFIYLFILFTVDVYVNNMTLFLYVSYYENKYFSEIKLYFCLANYFQKTLK